MATGNLQGLLTDALTHNTWQGYRSRLLGIGLVELAGGDMRAYIIVTVIALTIGGLLAWRLNGFAIFHAMFALLASPWFQPWDMLTPAIFVAFVIMVVEKWNSLWLVGLFVVGIFNHQSAMFIALWMILIRQHRYDGLACLVIGVFVMWAFQHTDQPKLGLYAFQGLDQWSTGWGTDYFQEQLFENIRNIEWTTVGLLVVIGMAIVAIRQRTALAITYFALLLSTFVFGRVNELRVYLPFIPVVILCTK